MKHHAKPMMRKKNKPDGRLQTEIGRAKPPLPFKEDWQMERRERRGFVLGKIL